MAEKRIWPVGLDVHAGVLEDGSVVSPGGGGQVDDFVAGEPLGQEVSTDPEGGSKRDHNKCIFVITL